MPLRAANATILLVKLASDYIFTTAAKLLTHSGVASGIVSAAAVLVAMWNWIDST